MSEILWISEHAQKSKNSKEFLGHENPKDSHKPLVFDISKSFISTFLLEKEKRPKEKNKGGLNGES